MKELKQLKDFITILDVLNNDEDGVCITSHFNTLDPSKYNPFLIALINTNNDELTQEYLGNRLDRILSPLYLRIINHYIEVVGYDPSDAIENANGQLIKIIENKFLFNWDKLAEGFFADYNPIHNYDMKENEGIDINNKSTTENKVTQKYAGFNSGDDLPVATESEGETETSGTSEFNNSDRELTRSGNIGVTTTAQMLEQEFNLRKRTLLDKIFDDIDTILFLDYYK